MKPAQRNRMSLADRLAAWPEPSAEAKAASKLRVIAENAEREKERRANAWPVLALGELVRLDIWGWRDHDARVIEDKGPAESGRRIIKVERVGGPNNGETVTVRRDRLRLSPGQ